MDQLIRIVQKTNIKTDAIFSSQLKTRWSRDGLAGYQSTFEDFVESLRNDNPNDNNVMVGRMFLWINLWLDYCWTKFEV